MTQSREDSVYLAKLAEQAERYEGRHLLLLACRCVFISHDRDGRKHETCRFI